MRCSRRTSRLAGGTIHHAIITPILDHTFVLLRQLDHGGRSAERRHDADVGGRGPPANNVLDDLESHKCGDSGDVGELGPPANNYNNVLDDLSKSRKCGEGHSRMYGRVVRV